MLVGYDGGLLRVSLNWMFHGSVICTYGPGGLWKCTYVGTIYLYILDLSGCYRTMCTYSGLKWYISVRNMYDYSWKDMLKKKVGIRVFYLAGL